MFTGDDKSVNTCGDRMYFCFEFLDEISLEFIPLLQCIEAFLPEKIVRLIVTNTISRKYSIVSLPGTLNKMKSSTSEFFSVLIQKLLDRSSTCLFGTNVDNSFQVKFPWELCNRGSMSVD